MGRSDIDNGRQRCEVWTRVMGYYRPVSFFNTGKKSEYYSREYFKDPIVEDNRRFIAEFGSAA